MYIILCDFNFPPDPQYAFAIFPATAHRWSLRVAAQRDPRRCFTQLFYVSFYFPVRAYLHVRLSRGRGNGWLTLPTTPDILVVVYAVVYIATFINPLSTVDLINVVYLVLVTAYFMSASANLTYCTTLTRTSRNNNSLYWMCRPRIARYIEYVALEIMITGRIFHYYLLEHTSSFEHRRFRWSEKFVRFSWPRKRYEKNRIAITNIRTNGSYIPAAAIDAPFNDQKNGICSVPILRNSTHSRGHS